MAEQEVAEASAEAAPAAASSFDQYKSELIGIAAQESGETAPAEQTETTDDKGTQTTEPVQDAATETKAFELTPKQRAWARNLGYTDEKLSQFDTKVLETFASFLETVGPEHSRQLSKAGREKQKEAAKPKEEVSSPSEEALKTFNEEDIGEIAPHLNAVPKLVDELRTLRTELQELKAGRQEDLTKTVKSKSDAFFASDEAKSMGLFGEGSLDDLQEDDPECQSRLEVMEEASKIRERVKGLSVEDSLKRAMIVLHTDAFSEAVSRKVKAETERKLKERSQQRTIPPSTKTSKLPVDDEATAISHLEDIAAKLGIRKT